jgi:transcriptional regulator with XRE-family HTH domain
VPEKDTSRIVSTEVARLLRKERIRAGLSVYRVAKRSGVSQQMIGYVERGMRNPTLDTLLRITGALNVDLSKLIKRATAGTKMKQSRR